MKLVAPKGIKPEDVGRLTQDMFNDVIKDIEFTSLGNITILFDVYNNGKKVDTKEVWKYKLEKAEE